MVIGGWGEEGAYWKEGAYSRIYGISKGVHAPERWAHYKEESGTLHQEICFIFSKFVS